MKKKLIGLVVGILIVILSVQSVFAGNIVTNALKSIFGAEEKVTVKLNGYIITFPDAQPFVDENSRTLVPIRFVAEAMGTDVKWEENGKTETVTLKKGNKTIDLKIGEYGATVNGQRWALDTAAIMKEDRTFVPLRFVSEIMGATIGWDESTNTVSITDSSITYTPTPSPVITPTTKPIETVTPNPTISPEDYNSPKDKFRGVELSDPTAKNIYNLGYYVEASGFGTSSYGIAFTDKPNGKINFSVSVSQYNVSLKLQYITPLTKEMLYKTLKIIYPDNYEEYYTLCISRIENNETGNRFTNLNGLTFYTQYNNYPEDTPTFGYPDDTLYITVYPTKD